ncbi:MULTISPECIES: ChaB family protein [Cyanophyceae]|uniref:ChaB family protein n=1 Tax=Cyanophyceae TaxID=3028117 RepID=UPI001686CFF9|nr:ChaB family protein [Trichocoleus sp. FACHB-69]MBD1932988.1 ChaB family protein [Trichocoleus sp. FACHB-69]
MSIGSRLFEAAQDLYRAAFNAVQWYAEESKAHEVARRAVRSESANLNSTIGKCLEPIFAPSY